MRLFSRDALQRVCPTTADCVQYSCKLLQRLRQNEISQAAALERVAQARGLLEQIEARLPAASAKRIWQRINERWDLEELKSLLASGELDPGTLMAIVALDVHLTKYFRIIEEKDGAADGGLKAGTNEADTKAYGVEPTVPKCDQDPRTESNDRHTES